MDYKNGKIYKLVNSVDDAIYVGSTTSTLPKRFYHHKSEAKHKHKPRPVHVHLNPIGWENVDIVLIEDYKCENKNQLHARERYWIETLRPSLNKVIPTRTKQEWYEDNKEYVDQKKKEYRENNKEYLDQKTREWCENNKEILSQKKKEWYDANKSTILQKLMQKIKCDCGKEITYGNKSGHEKTTQHIKWFITS